LLSTLKAWIDTKFLKPAINIKLDPQTYMDKQIKKKNIDVDMGHA
jgi:hypothetical protein